MTEAEALRIVIQSAQGQDQANLQWLEAHKVLDPLFSGELPKEDLQANWNRVYKAYCELCRPTHPPLMRLPTREGLMIVEKARWGRSI